VPPVTTAFIACAHARRFSCLPCAQ
jgi:hypothetical protein